MAAYSNQEHHSYLPDQTVFFPNLTTGTSTSFPQLHQYHDQLSVENRLQSHSTSMALDDQKVSSGNLLLSKMRKDKQICSIYQAQTNKDTSNRLRKQKKTNDYQEEKKKKNIVKQGSIEEDGEIGYVHVRARRGQATDSHSLAERVRRQKVSERMKLLQAIVPGCDKITGRALVLDEIIGYVQSLQNQVEVLSMKLASVNTMLYDSGVDLDAFMHKLDENLSTIVQPTTTMTSVQEFRPNGRASATFSPATDIYPHMPQLIDGSAPANSLPFQQYSTLPNLLSQMLME